tara:strand:+ start:482 stop:1438 length:957 start_codon:yes stop_codon:yes gene_type:complete
MDLRNGDCLEVMKELEKDSVDLLFADLPYGQTSCRWDCLIDLELFWKEVNRVCKPDAPMVFTCTVKFGNTLINSNPKNFRYDLIWVKSAPCGFLNAKKMPMKKHEMVYVFYNKLPKVYTENIALHHTHKFLKGEKVKKEENVIKYDQEHNSQLYGEKLKRDDRKNKIIYDPPLPNSVIKEDTGVYNECDHSSSKKLVRDTKKYKNESVLYGEIDRPDFMRKKGESMYEPQLPNSILEMKSEKGKHATQKPVALMEWILKYYSREGGVVLDPTMGSGSMGVACKNQNRSFIGVEKDETIYKVARDRCGLENKIVEINKD